MPPSKQTSIQIDTRPQPAQIKGTVKFVNIDNNRFFSTVRKRVDEYFIQNDLSKFGNEELVLKTVILLLVYIIPFTLILFLQPGFLISLFLWSVMGFGVAGLGMSVMHDANHGAFSPNKRVNWLMAHVLNIIGGSTFNWKLQHNILHHT